MWCDGNALELGASIFWDHNQYVKTAAQRLGLRLRQLGGSGRGRQDVESESRPVGPQWAVTETEGQEGKEEAARHSGAEEGSDGGAEGHGAAGPAGKRARGFTVWNGTAFVVNMTGSWSDTLHAALRYGTAALRYKWLVGDAFRRFRQVYDMQAAGATWERPEALLHSLELYNETQQRCSDYMRSWLQQPLWWLWGGAAFADEVAGAANRCNYNQNNEQMNAFAGLVSYMPAAYGAVWQVEGGNRQLVSGLLAASGARLVAGARVMVVRRRPEDGRYLLEVEMVGRRRQEVRASGGVDVAREEGVAAKEARDDKEAEAREEESDGLDSSGSAGPRVEGDEKKTSLEVFGPYDAIVIAAPLLGSEIQFDLGDENRGDDNGGGDPKSSETTLTGGGKGEDDATVGVLTAGDAAAAAASAAGSSETVLQQPYQVTVTTYVSAGGLRPAYFNVTRVPPVARMFVSSGADAPFSSVAISRPAGHTLAAGAGGQSVYKIFSARELPLELIESLFESEPEPPRVLTSRRWYAYPRFQPPERFSPFQLAPGLVYGNALEPAASAMEIAAIEAHNSALLVTRHLQTLATSTLRIAWSREGAATAAADGVGSSAASSGATE